jgi:hypothetical protein
MSDPRRDRLLTLALCVGIVALLGVFLLNAAKHLKPDALGDLHAFYNGAVALRTGGDVYARGERNYIYPPLIALLYTPLSYLSIVNAGRILLVVNTLALLVSLVLLTRASLERFSRDDTEAHRVPSWRHAAIMLVSLAVLSDKVRSELRMWQTDLLLLLGMSLAIRLLDRRPVLAGLAMGFAFNIKFLPILFLPYLLLRRRFVAAGSFLIGIVGFAFLPAMIAGWHRNLELLSTAYAGLFQLVGLPVDPAAASGVEPIEADFSISITSFIARQFVKASGVDTRSTFVVVAIVAGVAAIVCLLAMRPTRLNPFLWPSAAAQRIMPYRAIFLAECAVLWAATLCFSPQLNPRHLSMLLFTIVPMCAFVVLSLSRTEESAATQDFEGRVFALHSGGRVTSLRPGERASSPPRRRALLLLGCLIAYFLALVLPPPSVSPMLDRALVAWRHISGHAWVLLGTLPVFLWVAGKWARPLGGTCLQTGAQDV